MLNRNQTPKFLKRFTSNRKGTAEVIGSVLFIIILLFAFSNIYLWHDNAIKTSNNLLSEKLNSQIETRWIMDGDDETSTLVVTNTGGVGASLSRLWVVNGGSHEYFDLTNRYVPAGGSIQFDVTQYHPKNTGDIFTVLTTLGNMASPKGQIIIVNNGGNEDEGTGDAPVGSVIIADFSTFNYYTTTGSGAISNRRYSYELTPSTHGTYIGFSVNLTNNDSLDRDIVLTNSSQMLFIGQRGPEAGKSAQAMYCRFFIVSTNPAETTISETYTPKTLEYGKSVAVYFASDTPMTFTETNFGDKVSDGAYPLNLALLGRFTNGGSLGQNIPFVTVNIVV